MSGDDVLAVARGQEYRAAENVRGAAAGALWLLTAPSIAGLRSITRIGEPSEAELAMLRALVRDVDVVPDVAALSRLGRQPDLVFAPSSALGRRPAAALDGIVGGLSDTGSLLIETRGHGASRIATSLADFGPTARVATLRAHPLRGAVRVLTAEANVEALPAVARAGLLRASFGEWTLRGLVARDGRANTTQPATSRRPRRGSVLRSARSVARLALAGASRAERLAAGWRPTGRFIVVHGPEAGWLPRYLRRLAGVGDADAQRISWVVASPGDFASQKVLWLVQAPDGPRMVIKMTRDPAFSHRLHRASAALRLLGEASDIPRVAVPRLIFSGEEAGLAIAGETAVSGEVLGRRGSRADDNAAREVLDALVAIGVATRRPATGANVAAALADLLRRASSLGVVGRSDAAFLQAELEVLIDLHEPLPIGLQHGDPGVLNVMARDGGGVTILDWENADASGIPLWDVLYFVRSLAVLRRRGDRVTAALAPFIQTGALNDLASDVIREATHRLGLPTVAVRPLVFHCWVQQALKEATRLPSAETGRSVFGAFLRRLIEAHDAPALRRIIGHERAA